MEFNHGTALAQANQLMDQANTEQAAALLEQVLADHPSDSDYADAASIYLMGHMHDQALSVFDRYQQATGRDLGSGRFGQHADFDRSDIEADQSAYQAARQAVGTVSDDGTILTLYPISPLYVFFMAFSALIGGWFIFGSLGHWGRLGIIMPLFGLYMVLVGVAGMVTYIRARPDGLELTAPKIRYTRSGRMKQQLMPLPNHRIIPYENLAKAEIMTISAGRGVGVGLKLFLKNGGRDLVNLGPFTKQGCRQLARKLQSNGVFVYVMPGLLGKKFRA